MISFNGRFIRLVALPLAALSVAAFATACGGDDDDGDTEPTQAAPSASASVSSSPPVAAAAYPIKVKDLLGREVENPYADVDRIDKVVGCRAHRKLAREVAQEAIVLLKNDGRLLPLPADLKRIADGLIGTKGVKHGKLTMTTTGKGLSI